MSLNFGSGGALLLFAFNTVCRVICSHIWTLSYCALVETYIEKFFSLCLVNVSMLVIFLLKEVHLFGWLLFNKSLHFECNSEILCFSMLHPMQTQTIATFYPSNKCFSTNVFLNSLSQKMYFIISEIKVCIATKSIFVSCYQTMKPF